MFLRGSGNTKLNSSLRITGSNVAVGGNAMALLDYQTAAVRKMPIMGEAAFSLLFFNNDAITLVVSNFLPAAELADWCYSKMFLGCKNLIQAPELPAVKLAAGCYDGMFAECESLTQSPALPAVKLADLCYCGMFAGCKNLFQAPELPAAELALECYERMFADCGKLTQTPAISTAGFASEFCRDMFSGCPAFANARKLQGPYSEPVQRVSPTPLSKSRNDVFSDTACVNFTAANAFELTTENSQPIGNLEYSTDGGVWQKWSGKKISSAAADDGAQILFLRGLGNTKLNGSLCITGSNVAVGGNIMVLLDYQTVSAGAVPLMGNLAFLCLFQHNSAITAVAANFLPAAELTNRCYFGMFRDCRNLVHAPELPAVKLSDGCYSYMFSRCTSLEQAPQLPATKLAYRCYRDMFSYCANLVKAPALPAMQLADFCYSSMFHCCPSLVQAPELPAVELAIECYESMFANCASLTQAPDLPAIKLADGCYANMFKDCVRLTQAPTISAVGLLSKFRRDMFAGCPALAGTIKRPESLQNDFSAQSFDEGDNDIFDDTVYVGFYAKEAIALMAAESKPIGNLEYSTDGLTWLEWDGSKITSAGSSVEQILFLRGRGNSKLNGSLCITGSNVAVGGNIMALLDYQTVSAGQMPVMGEYAFYRLFCNNPALSAVAADFLPAELLSYSCYREMFSHCSNLAHPPALPAARLADDCYYSMFNGCAQLTQAPKLPAALLAQGCYSFMFLDCPNLAEAPELPAAKLAYGCYLGMFSGCPKLTQAPALPAPELAESCYAFMFSGCTKLTQIPDLSGVKPADGCCEGMFSSCPAFDAAAIAAGCVNFTAQKPIGLTAENDRLMGTLEYSGNGITWAKWNGQEITSGDNGSGRQWLLLRGSGNRKINTSLRISGSEIAIGGNVMTLLDYQTVRAGDMPPMSGGAFCRLFWDNDDVAAVSQDFLPARELTDNCYREMFARCVNLRQPPALPAEKLAAGCYMEMFSGCLNLTQTPQISAAEFAFACCENMFAGCPALADRIISAAYTEFISQTAVTFTAPDVFKLTAEKSGELSATLEYSSNGAIWQQWDGGEIGSTSTGKKHLLFLRGSGNTALNGSLRIAGSEVTIGGNVMALLNYQTVSAGKMPKMGKGAFYRLFWNNADVAAVSQNFLPARELTDNCYREMFAQCVNLRQPPALPAEKLAAGCYMEMFSGCLNLTQTPQISAAEFAFACCENMFAGCPALADRIISAAYTEFISQTAVVFTAPDIIKLTAEKNGELSATLEYSSNGITWQKWDGKKIDSAADGKGLHRLMLRGSGNLRIDTSLRITGSSVAVGGNVMGLLDYKTVRAGKMPKMDSKAFYRLFRNNSGISAVCSDFLPAVNLTDCCYKEMFANCSSLTQAPELPAAALADSCYASMFADCYSLTETPELPAAKLAGFCYAYMFHGCIKLEHPPMLPAAELANGCYISMFANCTSLKQAPKLPAEELANGCYAYMFADCVSLLQAPELPAAKLVSKCYKMMFAHCLSLKQIPELPASRFASGCCDGMFFACPALSCHITAAGYVSFTAPMAIKLAAGNGRIMERLEYSGDGVAWSKWNGQEIISRDNGSGRQWLLLRGSGNRKLNTSLRISGSEITIGGNVMALLDYQTVSAGKMPPMGEGAFCRLFWNNDAISAVSQDFLPARELTANCYREMFAQCGNLIQTPNLPAAKLAAGCYKMMFADCGRLTQPPQIMASEFSFACCENMFAGCPALADSLTIAAYGKFIAQAAVTFTAPGVFKLTAEKSGELSATLEYSPDGMTWQQWDGKEIVSAGASSGHLLFLRGSGNRKLNTSLRISGSEITIGGNVMALLDYQTVSAGKMPPMGEGAFCRLFWNNDAISVVSQDFLPARELTANCYQEMFAQCGNLIQAPNLPAAKLAAGCYKMMFADCGRLTQAPQILAAEFAFAGCENMFAGCPALADSLTIAAYGKFIAQAAVTFTAPGVFKLTAEKNGGLSATLEYSPDGMTWQQWDGKEISSISGSRGEHLLSLRGSGNPTLNGSLRIAGSEVAIGGNVMALLDYQTVSAGEIPPMGEGAFCRLFWNNDAISAVSQDFLPARELTASCYREMFSRCVNLRQPPALPAEKLADGCYFGMFNGCLKLTQGPALPAVELAANCYKGMFQACRGLTQAPALPAVKLAGGCYLGMFNGCSALTRAPMLPAAEFAAKCYESMFYGCAKLVRAPALAAAALTDQYAQKMFLGCPVEISINKNSGRQFTNPPAMTKGRTVAAPAYVKFAADTAIAIELIFELDQPLANWEYSADGAAWHKWNGREIASDGAGGRHTLFLRGSGNAKLGASLYITGNNVAVSGNVMALLDYKTVSAGEMPKMGEYAFYRLFQNNSAITAVAKNFLPAAELAASCYRVMFAKCANLTQAPALTARKLACGCYLGMFQACKGLTQAPALPAAELASECYSAMFNGCANLIQAPDLPAAELADKCYIYMFNGCAKLARVPALPAAMLNDKRCQGIFSGCPGGVSLPR